MFEWISNLFTSSGFVPHGYCLSWNPQILWTLVISNALIGIAYYSIPVTLLYFLRRQKNLKFNWIFMMFGAFIFACGTGHFINILDIWHPVYQFDALLMAVTALISVATAAALWPLVPKASTLIDEHAEANHKLAEINQRFRGSMVTLELRNKQLEESERRFRLTLNNAPIGLAVVSLEGRFQIVNRALWTMLGYTEKELMTKTFQDITHPDDLLEDMGYVLDLIEGKRDSYRMVKRYIHKQGHIIDIQLDVSIQRTEDGIPIHFVSQIQDISEALRMQARLEHQARHDQLTGLPNRLAFDAALQKHCAETKQTDQTSYMLYLDLDHFKVVNDTCGHEAGDRLLCEVASVLKTTLRPNDYLARLGGDEFGIILTGVSAKAATKIAEKLITAVDDYQLTYSNQTFKVSLSIGMSPTNHSVGSYSMVLAQADTACYTAKDRGRGRVQMYQADDLEILQAEKTLSWAQRIQHAFEDNKFEIYLQSIMSRDKELVGFEALIRMHDTDNSIILPNDFLPSAQRMSWMTRIDQWTVTEVLKMISARKQPDMTYISVNLSAKSVSDQAFVTWLLGELDMQWTPNEALRFEITETEFLQTSQVVIYFFAELRRRGYRVSLDDFGSGYNSFNLLKRLQVDGIKIDSSFTRDLMRDPVDRALIEAIASIGQAMNIEVTAEGVEDEQTYRILHKMGIGAFQGHLFHRAEPAGRAITRRYIH